MSLQPRSTSPQALAGGSTHKRAALLLGVQNQLTTDAAQTSITIKRIICRRGNSIPHNVMEDKSEGHWDEATVEAEAGAYRIFHPRSFI